MTTNFDDLGTNTGTENVLTQSGKRLELIKSQECYRPYPMSFAYIDFGILFADFYDS